MPEHSESKNKQPTQEPRLRLEDLNSSLEVMRACLQNLATRVRVLPVVDKDGNSDCPFAENLYVDKEDAVKKVQEALDKLQRFLPLLEKNVATWSSKISHLQADKTAINDLKAREQYEFARHAAEHHYRKALQEKRELEELISRAHQQLKQAAEKTYPGGKPKRSSVQPAFWSGSPKPASAPQLAQWSIGGASLSNMTMGSQSLPADPLPRSTLSDLISLGPLGAKVK